MSVQMNDPDRLAGAAVVGCDMKKLGTVDAVYRDIESGRPEWVAVVSGLFGNQVSLVPLARAEFVGSDLRLPYDREQLRTAPHHDPTRALSPSDEAELFRHYDVHHGGEIGEPQSSDRTGDARMTADDTAASLGDRHDTLEPSTGEAMTRSEERLTAGTRTREVGRVRLRKHVVAEQQQVTVPVSHEELVVEREPITEADRGPGDVAPTISEEEREVVLHEQRPVVDKETEVVERVRLGTEVVTSAETVSGEVRKEEIEVDADDRPDTDPQPLREANRETT